MKVVAVRSIPDDFEIVAFLSEKGYHFHNHFVFYDFINDWQVWTLQVPRGKNFENYVIGLNGNKFILLDPCGKTFCREAIGRVLNKCIQ